MKREDVVWSYLPHPGCRRRKCFWEKIEKVHEYTAEGTATGQDCGPIVLRRTFKTCGQLQYGCPKKGAK